MVSQKQPRDRALEAKLAFHRDLKKHFNGPLEKVEIISRHFRSTSWVDLQPAVEKLLATCERVELFGVKSSEYRADVVTLSDLLAVPSFGSPDIGATTFIDLPDIGERRLRNGLWLAVGDVPIAILVTGSTLQIAATRGNGVYVDACIRAIEKTITTASTLRGRVISLVSSRGFGKSDGVNVHNLRQVSREEVILPAKTLEVLDANVTAFIRARQAMKNLGFSGKKGLLFYGPPGTGKTHTIHYLASQLPGHTTLLLGADDLGDVSEYFDLARFLQPAMIVIEDVDLIATARRGVTGGSGAELILNKLLNEMDGLLPDADVFVVLTTNAPETLESALVSRPGRIDQTIEFPLPDDESRSRLIKLYAGRLVLSSEMIVDIVKRTAGASGAFIKELMRRCAQYHIETSGQGILQQAAIDYAMDQMLFQGGTLNLKLLGGTGIGFSTAA